MGLNNKDESLSGSDHNRISSAWFFYGTCMVFMMLQAVKTTMKSVFGHNFLITSSPAYINNFQTVTDIVVILFRLSKDRFRLF
jgi:hypothetical protein